MTGEREAQPERPSEPYEVEGEKRYPESAPMIIDYFARVALIAAIILQCHPVLLPEIMSIRQPQRQRCDAVMCQAASGIFDVRSPEDTGQ